LEQGTYAVAWGDGPEQRRREITVLRELLDAKRGRKSEQLSSDQLALFAAAWQARQGAAEASGTTGSSDDEDKPAGGTGDSASPKRTGRQPLPRHRKRERMVHDLAEEEKHCDTCKQDLRPIGEASSERYEYIPAQLTVIEDVCKKYACAGTVKRATKPPQPMEKSPAGASLLAQLYRVEDQARPLTDADRLQVRQLESRPIPDKLRNYLLEIEAEVWPKSPEGRAVRYTLKNETGTDALLPGRRLRDRPQRH
jgi:transposase